MSSSDSNDARIDSRLRLASSVRASIRSFVWSPLSPLEWPFAVDIRQIKTVFSSIRHPPSSTLSIFSGSPPILYTVSKMNCSVFVFSSISWVMPAWSNKYCHSGLMS